MSISWTLPDWPAVGVRALSTHRSGGVSAPPYASLNLGAHVGDVPAAVAENRRRLAAAAGLPAEPAWLSQVHGARVIDLDAADAARPAGAADPDAGAAHPDAGADRPDAGAAGPIEADAAFTRQPGRVCAILTADCLPILLASDTGDLAAAVHAGWRGLAGGVVEAAVRALPVPPRKLVAWLGPAIGPRHFEVGPEVREALLQADPEAEAAFAPNARGRFMADLVQLTHRRLAALGVDRIHGSGECTFHQRDKYFSHRRDGVSGRQATLIWLEGASDR